MMQLMQQSTDTALTDWIRGNNQSAIPDRRPQPTKNSAKQRMSVTVVEHRKVRKSRGRTDPANPQPELEVSDANNEPAAVLDLPSQAALTELVNGC